MDPKTKNMLELGLDILTILVVADLVWTFGFNQKPPVEFFHNIVSYLGTAAAVWFGWKQVRKSKALG